MSRKKIIYCVCSIVLLIGVFAVLAVVVTSSTLATAGTDAKAESTNHKKSSAESGKESAEELIEQTLSREEIKESVGEWEKFEMNSNGCERGVYAGKFYYKEFTIYSRTYDKGETFHIMSVNE